MAKTITVGAVGTKPAKRSYGTRAAMVSWHQEPAAGKGRTVWNGVVATLVGAD